MNAGGAVLLIAGVWVLSQITLGQAVQRLDLLGQS